LHCPLLDVLENSRDRHTNINIKRKLRKQTVHIPQLADKEQTGGQTLLA
jgi:hypothetical protein